MEDDINTPEIRRTTSNMPDNQQQVEHSPHTFAVSEYQEQQLDEIKGLKLLTVMIALCLAVFCVALDNTIIATAIPKITDQFKTVEDVGWYGSACFLTTCVCQPIYGSFYTSFDTKGTFLFAVGLFEIGSLLCGVAQSSVAFIVGRAIAGLGAAGVISGPLVMIARVLPLQKRPRYSALILAMFGIASVAGPLMGGALSDRATWRWCFYINLPVGAVTTVLVILLLRLPEMPKRVHLNFISRARQIDFLGMALFIIATVCLLLALQWCDTPHTCSSAKTVVLFVLFGFFLSVFAATQLLKGNTAIVPPRVIGQRSMAFGSLFALCIGGSFFLYVYYLPLWFQAVDGVSATHSGIDNLPLLLSQVIGTIFSGALTTKFGHYMPFVLASVVFMSVGAAMLTTFHVGMPTGKWIGYQIIYGLGVGFGFQQAQLAAQAVLPAEDVAIGTAVMLFVQLLGGAIFLSVAQNVFTSHLLANLIATNVPGLDPSAVSRSGALEFRHVVPPASLDLVIRAYAEALTKAYQVGLIVSCIALLGPLGMKWRSLKGKPKLEAGL